MRLFGEKNWNIDRIWRLILAAILVVLLYSVLWALRAVLLPFALAFVLAYLLSPIVDFFVRHKCKRWLATLFVLLVFFSVLVSMVWFSIPRMINEFTKTSSQLADYLTDTYEYVFRERDEGEEAVANPIIQAVANQFSQENVDSFIEDTTKRVLRGTVSLAAYLVGFAIVPIAAFFFLSDFPRIHDRWELYIPKQLRKNGVPLAREVNSIISTFFRGQLIIVLILSVLFSIGFTIVGVPMAILMGFTIGFLNLIPYFGTLVGVFPLGLLTIGKSLQLGENPVERLLWVAVVMVVVQVIQDWILTPKIMKDRVGLRPITILMSAIIWGKLLGFIGLVLAIPLSAIGKVYFQRYFMNSDEIVEEHPAPPAPPSA